VRLLGEAVAAHREALKVYTREESPQQWAMTQNNLGAVLSSQGERAEGADGVRLLGEAVAAHREALKIFTREQSPQDWARTQNNLGAALMSQGERAEGAEGVRLLGEAVAAYRESLKVRTREELPQQWASTQNNLGNALRSQGERAERAEGVRLLNEAVAAYREAVKVLTREQSPQDWAMTQNNLAKAYFLLRNWLGAAEAYANTLTIYPDYEEAYARAGGLCHDMLFEFEKAFSLNQQWLARHPDDLSAQSDFAEKHFTTARFDECGRRINALLAKPEVSSSTKSALRAIEIADLLALNQADKILARMEALIAEVSRQPAEFKVEWVFDGTRHFISQTEKLSPYRDWLDKLFDAIGGKDRETILKGLKEAKESFKTK
jgi:tetratricopeptide (TPR) repeat protein